jgi:hypothetical protein
MGLNCNSYEENEMCKLCAKVQFRAEFALRKTGARLFFAQKRLAPSMKRKVLRCTASIATLFLLFNFACL